MLISGIIVILCLQPAYGQTKKTGTTNSKQKVQSAKIVFDILHAGNSKALFLKKPEVYCSLRGLNEQNNKVNVVFNGKNYLSDFPVRALPSNPKLKSSFKLKLTAKSNILAFTAAQNSVADSFNINFVVTDSINEYRIMAKCAKGKKTSFILSK
jgi:hypothetical protein